MSNSLNAPRTRIVCRYNAYGYAIYNLASGNFIVRGGNHPQAIDLYLDPDDPNALDITAVAKLCQLNAGLIAQDNPSLFMDGLDYDDSGERP